MLNHFSRPILFASEHVAVFILFYWNIYGVGWLHVVGSFKLCVSFAKEPYERDDFLLKRPTIYGTSYRSHPIANFGLPHVVNMGHPKLATGWLWLVGSLKLYVSFAKEPYKITCWQYVVNAPCVALQNSMLTTCCQYGWPQMAWGWNPMANFVDSDLTCGHFFIFLFFWLEHVANFVWSHVWLQHSATL